MNTAIVYYSQHHGNTKKLLGGIAKGYPTADEIAGAVKFYKGLQ